MKMKMPKGVIFMTGVKHSEIDYKLVYKLRRYNTDSLQNLRITYENEARKKAETEHQKYLDAIALELGHTNFEVSNYICMADGILNHVFAASDGSSMKFCIYCGCDNSDL